MAEELTEIQEATATTAEILEFTPFLQIDWVTGVQQALPSGEKLARTFSIVAPDITSQPQLELIDTDIFDEELEGSSYYRVTQVFNEAQFVSTSLDEHNNFLIWERYDNTHFLEIIYKNTNLTTLNWERPKTNYSVSSDNPDNYAPSGSSPTQTGSSTAKFTSSSTVTNSDSGSITTSNYFYYNSLPIPFKLSVSANKALGIEVINNSPVAHTLLKKATINEVGVIQTGLVVMDKPYLDIVFNAPTNEQPTNITVNFKGVEVSRGTISRTTQEEPTLLYHPLSVSEALRYLPPNEVFNQNFWNNGYFNNTAQDIVNRSSQNPAFI